MVQRTTRGKRISESHIIPLALFRSGSGVIARPAPVEAPSRRQALSFKLVGLLLMLPAIIVLSPPILLVLLGIFVVWLLIVGSMAVSIVMADVLGSMWRLRRALRALDQRAMAAGQ